MASATPSCAVCVRLSLRFPSRSCIVSKRVNVSLTVSLKMEDQNIPENVGLNVRGGKCRTKCRVENTEPENAGTPRNAASLVSLIQRTKSKNIVAKAKDCLVITGLDRSYHAIVSRRLSASCVLPCHKQLAFLSY